MLQISLVAELANVDVALLVSLRLECGQLVVEVGLRQIVIVCDFDELCFRQRLLAIERPNDVRV